MPEFTEGTTTTIPITGMQDGRMRQVIAHATVLDDPWTSNVLKKLCWSRGREGKPPSARLKLSDGGYKQVQLHHAIYAHYHGSLPPGYVRIIFRDDNPLNCVPDNLVPLTKGAPRAKAVNTLQSRPRRQPCLRTCVSRTGFRGVYVTKDNWRAQVMSQGRHVLSALFPKQNRAGVPPPRR